jgi:DegV family protein with EDD domain
MTGVRIVTDSSCDLPTDLAEQLGIEIVPLTIRFGAEEFVDRAQLSVEEFWKRCTASATLPETAAPAPGAFEAVYRGLLEDGATGIVVISLSSGMSATMQSAQLAAASVADRLPIEVVDSRSITMGLGMMCVAAARAAEAGQTTAEVADLARSLVGRTRVWGALDTIDNLKKGGRIGGAKALMASVLSIKPIIQVIDGKVEEGGKQRTRAKAMAFLVDRVREAGPIDNLAVMHAMCPDVGQLVELLRPIFPDPIVVAEIGAVIGAHAGAGTLGVVWQQRASAEPPL